MAGIKGSHCMSEKDNRPILEYYAQQSMITNPDKYAYLFNDLPDDIPSLVKTVQGLLISLPWEEAYGLDTPQKRHNEIYLRTVPQMLERILQLDSSPLIQERSPEKRKVSLCRDFAVLLISMLRHQGVPARLRIGFAGFYRAETPKFWDHRIAEYWNERLSSWILVDAMTDNIQLKRLKFQIDPLNINRNSPFLFAGDVWQRCRAAKASPEEFGDSPDDLGMPPIRYALLHDFDALNKVELVGFDTFHSLINKPEHEVTEDERSLLDEIAEVTTRVDSRFDDLQTLYATTSYGQAVLNQLSSLHLI